MAPNKCLSRAQTNCEVFGAPLEHRELTLPTYYDVMKHYLFVQHDMKNKNNGKEPSYKDISDNVISCIESVWKKASIPVVSTRRIQDMIKKYHEKYRKIIKLLSAKGSANKLEKVKTFRDDAKRKLFDICLCKCTELKRCNCSLSNKVPKEEQEFLLDQRTTRKMFIGSVNRALTIKTMQKSSRKLSDSFHFNIPGPSTSTSVLKPLLTNISDTDTDSGSDSLTQSSISDYEPSFSTMQRMRPEDKKASIDVKKWQY